MKVYYIDPMTDYSNPMVEALQEVINMLTGSTDIIAESLGIIHVENGVLHPRFLIKSDKPKASILTGILSNSNSKIERFSMMEVSKENFAFWGESTISKGIADFIGLEFVEVKDSKETEEASLKLYESDLEEAIENEDYTLASKLRDLINELKTKIQDGKK